MADLSCGASCLKYIMFFLNVIFWIVGGAMLGVGIWLAVDDNLGFLEGITDNPMDDPLFSAATYTIIAVGAFVFLLGFLGCCGACTQNTCMLCMYIIIVSIVLLAEIVGVILMLVYRDDIGSGIKDEMREFIIVRYDQDGDETGTEGQNLMQQDLKCCGALNFTDYRDSKWHEDNPPPKYVPDSCCKDEDDTQQCQEDAAGWDAERNSDHLYTKGCHQAVVDWIDDNAIIFIAVTCSFVALQILGLIFACCLKSSINKAGAV